MDIAISKLVRSWANTSGNVYSTADILAWIEQLNRTVNVSLKKIDLSECDNWYYNDQAGEIRHRNNIFFQIAGFRQWNNDKLECEQPIVLQHGIGYLGIICKEIDGVLNFLMQAKIEPGNVNRIQISPTIQATLSNFTQRHGGEKPKYLEYFLDANRYQIIVDQIQSEQASRFLKKRNRNIIIKVDEEIEIFPTFRWMTIGQIKELMKQDNIVNMDTRTVLSCIPFYQAKDIQESLFHDKPLYHSLFNSDEFDFPSIYYYINNYKMYHKIECSLIPLYSLTNWHMDNHEFVCKYPNNFKVVFCDINIEGREVIHWTQPLLEAIGQATFGLITCVKNGVRRFVVKACHEVGSFDKIELGPSVQLEPNYSRGNLDEVARILFDKLEKNQGILCDVVLSEEGGRFYHEQNRNIIVEVDTDELKQLPDGYFLTDYKTLNLMTQINDCLNIQLRNLLSLLEV